MDISQYLNLVADDMPHVEDKMRSGIAARYPDLASVVDYLIGAGGKRMRPVLSLLVTKFYEDVDMDKAYALGGSVELLHTATLVHDDLIDNSLLRRGMPTLNTSWSAGSTILAGDYLFARSAELAANTQNIRIVTAFSQTLMTIVGGELQQLFNDGHDNVPSHEEYEQRIYAKTASLFELSTLCGAILGSAPPAEEEAFRLYGYHLGKAFQIVDDILDFQGDEDVVGKPLANDLRQGIATLPVMLFSEGKPDHPTIIKAVRREALTEAELEAVVDEIRASGCIKAALEEAKVLAKKAQDNLSILPDNQYRQAMYAIADYAVSRNV